MRTRLDISGAHACAKPTVQKSSLSAQIALAVSDIDLGNGVISINKARVYGVDRYKTKTGGDRRVQLCPRALAVLKRHLLLRAGMESAKTSCGWAHKDIQQHHQRCAHGI